MNHALGFCLRRRQVLAAAVGGLPAWLAAQTSARVMGRVLAANPGNFQALLPTLQPGDTLQLAPGEYVGGQVPGLPLFELNGTPERPIVITGPAQGPRAVLIGRAGFNTVRLQNASYLVVRHLDIDSRDLGGHGVRAQAGWAHHISLEHLRIVGVGKDQQTVGISTTGTAVWGWVIRHCQIIGAGTGIYLGNSPGNHPFVDGLIEYNTVRDTLGYNLQIKHQVSRAGIVGMPEGVHNTIIRYNVFSKAARASSGQDARPNLLVGHVPLTGLGQDDRYEIYGNFFYQNPHEALFQGEGHVAFHHNVLINTYAQPAVQVQRHHGEVRTVHIFNNTVLSGGRGLVVRDAVSGFDQRLAGNAVFTADIPIAGPGQWLNVSDRLDRAARYLRRPHAALEDLDVSPQPALRGAPLDPQAWRALSDYDRDFARRPCDWSVRGAFSAPQIQGWRLD